jgi:predicted short-subunit dehydrogenase-like oxidoreductase (DUF2520 family)
MNIALIGTGRLGTSLGHALAGRGFSIAAIYDRSRAAALRARRIIDRGRLAKSGVDAARAADLVFLCLPDGELGATALELALAEVEWQGKIVLHTSGALSSAVLAPLRCEGAATGSFHPAQSFAGPETPPTAFSGTTIVVEGSRRAAAAGRRLAEALGGRILNIRTSEKTRYHAACCVASNLFIPLFDLACGLLEEAGVPPRRAEAALLPLMEGTLDNIRRLGRAKALTGPIARGDAATVGEHLEVLPRGDIHREVYRILGSRALRLAERNGLGKKDAAAVRRTLARR